MEAEPIPTPAEVPAKSLEGIRLVMKEALPYCELCKQRIEGHLFQHVACTPMAQGNLERLQALYDAVESENWADLQTYQEWDALKISADVIALQCTDGRCSLAVLYCPASINDIYKLIRQKKLNDRTNPLLQDFSDAI